jgi:putative ABC transport system substrate-binding protein
VKRARPAITLLLALALVCPPPAGLAQPPGKTLPRIGYLSGNVDSVNAAAFREGLRELGYVEGQNIAVEYRFAEGKYERLPGLAAGLVDLRVSVIVASTTPAIRSAQRATRTIPIVMTLGEAAEGSIVSLARPGGNITGLSTINTELTGKRLDLLKEALPRLSRVAVIYNPTNPISAGQVRSMEAATRALGVQLQLLEVKRAEDFVGAFESARRGGADALMGLPDQLVTTHRKQLSDLALKHRLPTMYWSAGLPESGSLMSYGPDLAAMHRRAATYVDRILKGAKPADLPVEQPAQFVFVINLRTAKALGLTIPPALVLRADRTIQ